MYVVYSWSNSYFSAVVTDALCDKLTQQMDVKTLRTLQGQLESRSLVVKIAPVSRYGVLYKRCTSAIAD